MNTKARVAFPWGVLIASGPRGLFILRSLCLLTGLCLHTTTASIKQDFSSSKLTETVAEQHKLQIDYLVTSSIFKWIKLFRYKIGKPVAIHCQKGVDCVG